MTDEYQRTMFDRANNYITKTVIDKAEDIKRMLGLDKFELAGVPTERRKPIPTRCRTTPLRNTRE